MPSSDDLKKLIEQCIDPAVVEQVAESALDRHMRELKEAADKHFIEGIPRQGHPNTSIRDMTLPDARRVIEESQEAAERSRIRGAGGAPPASPQILPHVPLNPSGYGLADDFDRDVSVGDWVFGNKLSGSGYAYIEDMYTGKRYRLDIPQLKERQLHTGKQQYQGKLKPQAVDKPVPSQPKLHIFHQGSPLCGFTSAPPRDWPQGHERISLDDFRRGVTIICSACAKEARCKP